MAALDLPLVWLALIALSVLLYVCLDGFDLGIGILFPLAGSPANRDRMMSAIAPFWDGNETWLVLGGGGLLAAFPLAYAALIPAFYLPVILMLLALVLRGVAFEFRRHGGRWGKPAWTAAFAGGSLVAALAQGLILGGFVQGVRLGEGAFAGGPWDWVTPFTFVFSAGLVAGYALLGATWLLLRTSGDLRRDARRWAAVAAFLVAVLLGAVSLETVVVHPLVANRWGFLGDGVRASLLARRLPIPLLGAAGLAIITLGLRYRSRRLPFAGALIVFLSGYLGLATSFVPFIVPYAMTFRQAANDRGALVLLTWGAAILLPMILAYTVWVYWVFGKAEEADADVA